MNKINYINTKQLLKNIYMKNVIKNWTVKYYIISNTKHPMKWVIVAVTYISLMAWCKKYKAKIDLNNSLYIYQKYFWND